MGSQRLAILALCSAIQAQPSVAGASDTVGIEIIYPILAIPVVVADTVFLIADIDAFKTRGGRLSTGWAIAQIGLGGIPTTVLGIGALAASSASQSFRLGVGIPAIVVGAGLIAHGVFSIAAPYRSADYYERFGHEFSLVAMPTVGGWSGTAHLRF